MRSVRRVLDSGEPIDPSGQLVDGTRLEGPVGLRKVLLGHADFSAARSRRSC